MFYERLLGYRKEETVLHHQPKVYDEEADILYNSIHDEEADISHSSIHDENTGILYRSIRNEEADNLYRSIQNENTDTSYNSSSEKTDISYRHIHHENASIFYNSNHNESANAAHHHTMNDMSIRSAAIYAILKQIRETENSLYQEIILKQNPVLYEYPVSEPYNRALADDAKGIANQIAVHTADRKAQSFQETAHIELVHKKEETVSEEDTVCGRADPAKQQGTKYKTKSKHTSTDTAGTSRAGAGCAKTIPGYRTGTNRTAGQPEPENTGAYHFGQGLSRIGEKTKE